jgi:RNA recognition motif-containing protein
MLRTCTTVSTMPSCVSSFLASATSRGLSSPWVRAHFLSVRVAIDRTSGRPRGFGFVKFETAEQAAKALTEMNGVMDSIIYT